MKRWLSIILGTVMAVVCMTALTVPAFAAETPSVSIPVTVSLTGTQPEQAEDFAVVLKADDAAYPMPDGAENGAYTMTVTGADTKNLPTIAYDRVGIYTYTIAQTAGSNTKCTYDDTVYTLTVQVTNAEDGSGLEAVAVLYPDAEGDKQPGAVFQNAYAVEPTPTPSPVPTPTAEPTQEPSETAEPEPTADPNGSSNADAPKTGDAFSPVLYVALSAASLGAIAALLLIRKHRKTEE